MTLAFTNQAQVVALNDSAELYSYLSVNNIPVTADQISYVMFRIQMPDGTIQSTQGTIQPDGAGFLRWLKTDTIGAYRVQAQFYLVSGEIRSNYFNFTVIDPFNDEPPSPIDFIVYQVQLRLEDLFDSVEGGPWLRDMTQAHFDYTKIAQFIPEAIFDINVQMPPTNYTLDYFTMSNVPFNPEDPTTINPNMPLLIKGVLVLTIKHLIRSYVEQPIPQGGQIIWHDRTRYSNAWQAVYQIEYQEYINNVRLAKRTEYNFGNAASLIFNKAGRMWPFQNARSRGMWRGYY